MAGTSKNVLTFTDANFESDVIASPTPVLVDFWAVWCQPCKQIAPIVEELADSYGPALRVGKLDIDSQQATAVRYNIRSIPTLLLFKNGKVAEMIVGNQGKAKIQATIARVLG